MSDKAGPCLANPYGVNVREYVLCYHECVYSATPPHPTPKNIAALTICTSACVCVSVWGPALGGVTGEATTRAHWVHLLPRWQEMRSALAVAIANRGEARKNSFRHNLKDHGRAFSSPGL